MPPARPCFALSEPLHIFMMELSKIAGPHLIDLQPGIFEHLLIYKDCSSASVQYDDVVRYQINDPPQLVLVFKELGVSGQGSPLCTSCCRWEPCASGGICSSVPHVTYEEA